METSEAHEAFAQARRPTFMGGASTQVVNRATFASVPAGENRPMRAPVVRSILRRPASFAESPEVLETLEPESTPEPIIVDDPPPHGETPAPAEPTLPPATAAHVSEFGPPIPAEFVSPSSLPVHPPAAVDYAERLAAGVAALRMTSERLAEQARSDALELALLVSRRILEAELSTNVERFFTVIRGVIRRAGESNRVVIRLHPEDAARVEAAGGARGLPNMAVSQVEISGDPELELGDCMVEADFGVVDGRLSTRLEEMRRLLLEAMSEES